VQEDGVRGGGERLGECADGPDGPIACQTRGFADIAREHVLGVVGANGSNCLDASLPLCRNSGADGVGDGNDRGVGVNPVFVASEAVHDGDGNFVRVLHMHLFCFVSQQLF
jgi:hypothetical protein